MSSLQLSAARWLRAKLSAGRSYPHTPASGEVLTLLTGAPAAAAAATAGGVNGAAWPFPASVTLSVTDTSASALSSEPRPCAGAAKATSAGPAALLLLVSSTLELGSGAGGGLPVLPPGVAEELSGAWGRLASLLDSLGGPELGGSTGGGGTGGASPPPLPLMVLVALPQESADAAGPDEPPLPTPATDAAVNAVKTHLALAAAGWPKARADRIAGVRVKPLAWGPAADGCLAGALRELAAGAPPPPPAAAVHLEALVRGAADAALSAAAAAAHGRWQGDSGGVDTAAVSAFNTTVAALAGSADASAGSATGAAGHPSPELRDSSGA
eukprot:287200-Chlamydomonas_euryale.AAC.1